MSTTCSKPHGYRWRRAEAVTNEVVNAEVQRDRVLVRFEVLAVAQPLALKPLQFLPNARHRHVPSSAANDD